MSVSRFTIEVVTRDKNRVKVAHTGFLPNGEPVPDSVIADEFDRMAKIASDILHHDSVQPGQKEQ